MEPIPRSPSLDERLACEGGSEEILQVYADWLLERNHPLSSYIIDALRAGSGDGRAHLRTIERRFETADPEECPNTRLSWCAGVVVGLEAKPLGERWNDPQGILAAPVFSLLTSIQLRGDNDATLEWIDALDQAPPSLGRLEVDAPKDDPLCVALGHIRLPYLSDLRLRASEITSLPPHLSSLSRLEICADSLRGLDALRERGPLRELRELHLSCRVGSEAVRALVALAPALSVLGLHHSGPVDELLAMLSGVELPRSLSELSISVLAPSRRDLEQIALLAPGVGRLRVPWGRPSEPLPERFTAAIAPDQPLYLL